jgi:hypothetical protein
MKKEIEQQLKEKQDTARRIEGLINSDIWKLVLQVIERNYKAPEDQCQRCESEKFLQKVDAEMISIIDSGTFASQELEKIAKK